MPYIRKDNNTVTNKLVYVSGPPGSQGDPGPQGPQGPGGSGSDFNSANITVSTDGTLGVGALDHPNLLKACVVTLTSSAVRTIHGMLSDTTIGNMNPIKEIRNGNAPGGSDFILIHNSGSAASAKDRFNITEGSSYTIRPGESVKFGGYDYLSELWLKTADSTLVDGELASVLATRIGKKDGEVRQCSGVAAVGVGAGKFRWHAGDSSTAVLGMVLGSGAGRWKRVYDGPLNVKWFGARGDGVTDDSVAIKSCATAISGRTQTNPDLTGPYNPAYDGFPDQRGAIYFPAGRYRMASGNQIYPGSNCIVYGDGDASVIVHESVGAFNFDRTTGSRVTGLRFEHPHVLDFMTSIYAYGAEDLTIDHCSFACTAADSEFPPPLGSNVAVGVATLTAIGAQYSRGLIVHDNRVYRMQFKLGGQNGAHRVHAHHNIIEEPFDLGISCVGAFPTAEVTSINISDNIIRTPRSSGGIYVGADGQGSGLLRFADIVIARNQITSELTISSPAQAFLIVNLGDENDSILIDGNTLTNEVQNGGAFGASMTIGMSSESPTYCNNMRIINNVVKGADLYGINIAMVGENLEVSGNRTSLCRGISIASNPGSISRMIVDNNIVVGGHIKLDATVAAMNDIAVERNQVGMEGTQFNNGGILLVSDGEVISGVVRRNRVYDAGLVGGDPVGIFQGDPLAVYTSTNEVTLNVVENDCRQIGTGARLTSKAIGNSNRGSGFPSSAPTTGTWSSGDHVQNHNPTVGQPKGWICTVGGTPGTWVSEGNL